MNVEIVRSVFGAVAPVPVIAEKKSNLIPVILLIAVVGVGYIVYCDIKRAGDEKLKKNFSKPIY